MLAVIAMQSEQAMHALLAVQATLGGWRWQRSAGGEGGALVVRQAHYERHLRNPRAVARKTSRPRIESGAGSNPLPQEMD